MTLSTDTKPMWASQTVWGALAAIGAGLGTAIYSYRMGDPGTALTALVAAFGGLTAMVGRIKATSQIGKTVQAAVVIADQALIDYANSKSSQDKKSDQVPQL